VIVCNGHGYPQLDQAAGASAPYRQRRLLYHNPAMALEEGGATLSFGPRVGAAGDDRLDDDGRIDLALNDLDGCPQVLRNVPASRQLAWAGSPARAEPERRGAVVR
jgi:hypothetical protein